MKTQLAELVNVILQRLEDSTETAPSETRMRRWLAGQGYSKRDIDDAIKLVWPRVAAKPAPQQRRPGTVRLLSAFEAYKLSDEARDALARLDLYELIDPIEREMMLDRLGQFEGAVTLEELDYLLSWLTGATRDVESQQTIFDVFEGSAPTLH